MTKSLDEFFNLSTSDDAGEVEGVSNEGLPDTLPQQGRSISTGVTAAERVDHALSTIADLSTHDGEMDEISSKALQTFDQLVTLGGNVSDMHAGKVFEVAGQLLKTALDARNSKAERQLKMIDLQIKKAKLDTIDPNSSGGRSDGIEFDRNELLKMIAVEPKVVEVKSTPPVQSEHPV